MSNLNTDLMTALLKNESIDEGNGFYEQDLDISYGRLHIKMPALKKFILLSYSLL